LEVGNDSVQVGLAGLEVASGAEEVLQRLLLLVRVGRVVLLREGLAAEEVGQDYASLGGFGKNVDTLLGGRPETEDVVYDNDRLLGILGAGNVRVQTAQLQSFTLGRAAKTKMCKRSALRRWKRQG
jgi:hypothetical protein